MVFDQLKKEIKVHSNVSVKQLESVYRLKLKSTKDTPCQFNIKPVRFLKPHRFTRLGVLFRALPGHFQGLAGLRVGVGRT
jgi:hypothetical protein